MGKYFNAILTIVAILSGWLVWYFLIEINTEKPANPKTPDGFVNTLQVTVMNDQGDREYQFSSPFMLHYAENDRTTFTLPHLLMFEKDEPPWQTTALNGEALHGNTQINLSGNVLLSQPKSKNNPPSDIKTNKLIIYPKQRLVTTDQYVFATQPNNQLSGVGMNLNLNTQILNILSVVNGTFLQPSKPPTHIIANTAGFNKSTGIGVFNGQVKLTQGTSILITPQLNLYINNNNQLLKAIAQGPGSIYQSVPDPKKPPFVATAQIMQYFPPQNEIRLIGDAKATQGPNSYAAPEIYYHIDREEVVSNIGRTTIVLEPKTLKRDP